MFYYFIILSLFSFNKQFNLFKEVQSAKFENDYKLINDLFYHNKDTDTFNRFLSPYFFIADKNNAKLYLYFYNGDTKLLKTYNIVSGEVSGDKLELNDKKTPEGIYFFEYYLDHKTLLSRFGTQESKQYGPLAITMSYPNPIDNLENKTGNGIWLHGVETNDRIVKKFDTRGCIASANYDLPNIAQFVQTQTTPIIVYDTFKEDPINYKIIVPDTFYNFIRAWQTAWENKDLLAYMNSYHDKFLAPNKQNKRQWQEHKEHLNKAYSYIKVGIHNLSYYKHDKYTVAQFYQVYEAPGKIFKGIKRLYLIKQDLDYKILSEEFVSTNQVRYVGASPNY